MDYKLEVEHDSENQNTTVHWGKDPEAPSVKLGLGGMAGLFVAFIIIACIITAIVFYICKKREEKAREDHEAENAKRISDIKDHLECKPWCHPDDQTRAFKKASTLTMNSVICGSYTVPSQLMGASVLLHQSKQSQLPPVIERPSDATTETMVSMDGEAEDLSTDTFGPSPKQPQQPEQALPSVQEDVEHHDADVEQALPLQPQQQLQDTTHTAIEVISATATSSTQPRRYPKPPVGHSFHTRHNGFYCAICVEAFSPGEPIYNSNNPNCQHQIHASCMDKWIECQNICPVCSNPFVLL